MILKRLKHLDEKGFALIDVIIAVVIISVGIIAYGKFSGNMIEKNDHSKRATTATLRAQEKLEDLKNQSTNAALATGNGSDTPDTGFARTWTITNGGAGNLATVTATVRWTEDTAYSVVLSSQISQ